MGRTKVLELEREKERKQVITAIREDLRKRKCVQPRSLAGSSDVKRSQKRITPDHVRGRRK